MNFDRVLDDLYVGQKIDTREMLLALQQSGVTATLNLSDPETVWTGPSLRLPQEDDGSLRSAVQVKTAIDYYREVREARGVLYVHCQWGMGRAPAMCYAILRANGWGGPVTVEIIVNRARKAAAQYKPNWKRYIPSIEEALRA